MKQSVSITALILTAVFWAYLQSAPAKAQAGADNSGNAATSLAAKRAEHLRHGINLSDWLMASGNPPAIKKQHFDAAITDRDLALIRAMGFDHVRLCIDPTPMFQRGHADQIPPEYAGYLDTAVKMIVAHGLAVEMDIHASEKFKEELSTNDVLAEQFTDFWRGLAEHFANTDPNLVFFEILNEPELRDRYRWYGIETEVANAIRQAAPQHTIIAAGARWSDDDDLVFMDPLRDGNVIYNFHFYESHIFTHQGATWSENYFHFLKDVPYPSTPENVQAAAMEVPDRAQRLAVIRYGMDRWDARRIDADITQVADWANHWGVPVICNEFGVYRKNADPGDRAAWIHDVRTSLEAHGIGWAMWDYDGGFGVVTRPGRQAVPDPMTIKALGLTVPNTIQ
ncbi:MAG TPA: cellulase family glycosylhydrolase [Candidatus Acidoferrum sp.]|nr:cellulase family glycosylhydrolase [Candidatus Acidoferrum sp.]